MNVAVIGAGISGLSCAWSLTRGGGLAQARAATERPPSVTLYEAAGRLGGHTNTVDIEVDGVTHGVDTGFLVFNERTYPNLIRLFETLGVATARSEMTFSVRVAEAGARAVEWAGTDLGAVFAQRRNLVSPAFLRMLADLVRFNRAANALAAADAPALATWTLGEYLDANDYSRAFRDWYLLPMAAAIWSCPVAQMRRFPLATFVRFCANHGLLQITERPQWFTVAGGARNYVERIAATLDDVRPATPVLSVARTRIDGAPKVAVRGAHGTTIHDHVVFACHSDQALAALDDADADERAVLGAIRYQSNRAVLHTDIAVLPTRRRAWAAWNYRSDVAADRRGDPTASVSVHYLINKLQPVPFARPVIVSLNPTLAPDPASVHATFDYAHPVFDGRAMQAQRRLADFQGRGNVWFCGAWTGYGFHEDGLVSGLAVADAIAHRVAMAEPLPEARLAA